MEQSSQVDKKAKSNYIFPICGEVIKEFTKHKKETILFIVRVVVTLALS